MERINSISIFIALLAVLFFGCKEEGRIDHIDKNVPAPAQVTNVTVRNIPGGAVLKYTLPDDDNLLSVKAVYEIQPGVQREKESSFYQDSLVLEGFGDTKTYNVLLYSIGMNEKASEPLTVQINPTTAPVQLATKRLRETFGGVRIDIENPEKTNLAVVLMGDTANLGYQIILETFYTSLENVIFTYRGLNSEQYVFSVYLRDRWNNLSDTVTAPLTPWFEEFIPKTTWEAVHLPTDSWQPLSDNPIFSLDKFWDGTDNLMSGFLSPATSPLPQWQTWTMNQTILMSRFKFWQNNTYPWQFYNADEFELWGSVNPNPDGSWDESWIPLGKYECSKLKPSGLPYGQMTDEDIALARNGFDFELEETEFAPNPFVPIRYLRLKTNSTLLGRPATSMLYLTEISIWGQIIN